MMASLSEFATTVIIIIAVMIAGYSAARELRPSDHGLVFQTSPPANSSLEMRSFFNNSKGSSSSGVSLRNATESLPPSWWTSTGGGGGGGRGGHLGRALMVASLVCGVTGGILLVASGLLYLFKNRKKPNQNESFHADNNNNNYDNNANKLQLVRNL